MVCLHQFLFSVINREFSRRAVAAFDSIITYVRTYVDVAWWSGSGDTVHGRLKEGMINWSRFRIECGAVVDRTIWRDTILNHIHSALLTIPFVVESVARASTLASHCTHTHTHTVKQQTPLAFALALLLWFFSLHSMFLIIHKYIVCLWLYWIIKYTNEVPSLRSCFILKRDIETARERERQRQA